MSARPPSGTASAAIRIRPLRGEAEARLCAQLMAASEPWLTLRRDFHHALQLLTDPRGEAYVAQLGETIAGHLLLDMNGPFAGYIRVLAVAAAFRSRGIGAQLLQFAEQRIFRESPNIFLCVSSFNPRAQAFYERHGYARIGVLKEYVVRGSDEILLRKTIAPKSEFKPA
jgi:ribosomal protein S18 acetylase RimI-like enzyme